MTLTPDDKRIRLEALTKLAIATREKAEPQTFAVYLEDLAAWRTSTLVEACRRLRLTAQWFPKVAEIAEACRAVAREAELRADARRLKPAEFVPVPAERVEEFKRQIRVAIGRKGMP
jgi:hypothetical protein